MDSFDDVKVKKQKIDTTEENSAAPEEAKKPELIEIKSAALTFNTNKPHAFGSYGFVFFANYMNKPVAVKIFKDNKADNDISERIDPKIEGQIQHAAQHDYVVKLYGYIQDQNFDALVMEECTKGDLLDFINTTTVARTWQERNQFTVNIGFALSYIHDVCNMIHADIKPDNIMLQENNGITVAKISDFGAAIILKPGESTYISKCCKGTPMYQAPELVTSEMTFAVDMFAFGILLKALTATSNQYFITSHKNEREAFKYNASGAYENTLIDPDHTTEATRKVILRLLRTNPAERMTSKEFAALNVALLKPAT